MKRNWFIDLENNTVYSKKKKRKKAFKNKARTKQFRRSKCQTHCEFLLFEQIQHLGFYPQQPVGKFIADFYHPKSGVIVEVDGSFHDREGGKSYDAFRDSVIAQEGHKVLRFRNEQIGNDLASVVKEIRKAVGLE